MPISIPRRVITDAVLYRVVTAIDVWAPPTVSSVDLVAGSNLPEDTYNIAVAGRHGNYGNGKSERLTAKTVTAGNQVLDVRFVTTGYTTTYDIFCSTDADPLWLANCTASQVDSGCIVTAYQTVAANDGSVPVNCVRVKAVGEGEPYSNVCYHNRAYYIPLTTYLPSPYYIDGTNHELMWLDVSATIANHDSAPRLRFAPFYQRTDGGVWSQGQSVDFDFGGPSGHTNCNMQSFLIEIHGRRCHILVEDIGASVSSATMHYRLS